MKAVDIDSGNGRQIVASHNFVVFSIVLIFHVFMKLIVEVEFFVTLITAIFYGGNYWLSDKVNIRIANFRFLTSDTLLTDFRVIALGVKSRGFLIHATLFLFFVAIFGVRILRLERFFVVSILLIESVAAIAGILVLILILI